MTQLQQHYLSAAFPGMSGHEVDQLAADIKAHGQREPGVMFEGQVLDGWHRSRACEIAGVEFVTVDFPADADPVAFVKSRNLHRRHLTDSQRGLATVACSKWAPAGRPVNPVPGAGLQTVAEMAAEADVSERTIHRAKAAHTAGLGEAVTEGKISVKRAAEIAHDNPAAVKKLAAGKVTADEVIEKADKAKAKAKTASKILPRRDVPDAPAPASVPTAEAPKAKRTVDDLEAENERLRTENTELRTENTEMALLLEGTTFTDEGTEAAAKEIARLNGVLHTVESRRDGLMTTNAEMTRTIKSLNRRIDKLEKAAGAAAK